MTRKGTLWSATTLALLSCLWAGEGGLVVSASAQNPPQAATQVEAAPAAESAPVESAPAEPAAPPEHSGQAPADTATEAVSAAEETVPVEAATGEEPPSGEPGAENAAGDASPDGSVDLDELENAPLDEPKQLADIRDMPPAQDWATLTNPVSADEGSVARGKALFQGKGMCFLCHGKDGDGVTPSRNEFKPVPNDFFGEEWHDQVTDGQIMQTLQMGKLGTAMVPFVPEYLTELEAWDVVNFLRTLRGQTTPALEALREYLKKQEEEKQRQLQGGGG